MQLAISNIAWQAADDDRMLAALPDYDVSGVEIAPTVIFGGWDISGKALQDYKHKLDAYKLTVPAFQSILFGKPHLQLFDTAVHQELKEHIRSVADMANVLGAKVLVLGAPKNRLRRQLSYPQAETIATDILGELAEICRQRSCCLGLEHNPVEYGCDFVTNVADARYIVDKVNSPGLQLHLDAAGLHMCGGDISRLISSVGKFVHYHISEPLLAPITENKADHQTALNTLREINYNGWVSIEMKAPSQPQQVFESLEFVRQCLK